MIIKRYENKIALVTGAAMGIGLAMAKRLLAEGAKVAALDIAVDEMKEVYAGMEDSVLPLYCDVSSKASVDEAVKQFWIISEESMWDSVMQASSVVRVCWTPPKSSGERLSILT